MNSEKGSPASLPENGTYAVRDAKDLPKRKINAAPGERVGSAFSLARGHGSGTDLR
jgi:hypothetical protein